MVSTRSFLVTNTNKNVLIEDSRNIISDKAPIEVYDANGNTTRLICNTFRMTRIDMQYVFTKKLT